MRRAILHIGPRKTGTTSIQGLLSRRRPALLAQGVCYPVSPGKIMHTKLHTLMSQLRAGRSLASQRGVTEENAGNAEFIKNFDTEMKELPSSVNRVILSEERLSLMSSSAHIQHLKDFLQPYVTDFTVVLYLRSQDSYVASRYSELLRLGTLDGPDNVVATPERLWHHDYEALIERWETVFGRSAMTPRVYERGETKSFDSVHDFLTVCGVQLDESEDGSARLRNSSMTFAGQRLMLLLAERIKAQSGDPEIRYSLWREISTAISASVPGQGWLPARGEAAAFMQRFEASNEAVRRRYFSDRPRLFKDDSARFSPEAVEPSEAAILDAACQTLLTYAAKLEKVGRLRDLRRTPDERKAHRLGRAKRRQNREQTDLHDEAEEGSDDA